MKNIDIEKFYIKINGSIALVTAYAQNPLLFKIIKSCRLKPHSVFEENFQFSTKLDSIWVDEFGNSLQIEPHRLHLKINDLSLDKETQNSTDLFYGTSIKDTGKNSKFVLIATGTDLLSEDDFSLISFYGLDEYTRTFIFTPQGWTRVSPLMMGIGTTLKFFESLTIPWITEIDKKDLDFVIPFNIIKCVTTSWPTKQDIGFYFGDDTIINKIRSN